MTVEARKVEVYEDSGGDWRWRAKDSNGKIVAESGEGYESATYCRQAVRDLFPMAIMETLEVLGPRE